MAKHAATPRGRAHYGRISEVAEYVFQFKRTSEGQFLKFGVVAFSKLEGQGAGAAGDRFSGLETDTTPSGDGEQDESGAISASNKIASTRYKVQLFQDRILTDVRIRI